MEPAETRSCTQPPGVLADVWRTRVWRLFPLFMLYVIFYLLELACLFLPVAGHCLCWAEKWGSQSYVSVSCRLAYACLTGLLSQACLDAHASVVLWSSWSDFFSNSVLLFLLAPLVGRWSDAYGRKPFLIICFALASLPVLVLVLHMRYNISLLFYFPAQVITGAFSSVSIALSYIADVIHPQNRAPAFGIMMASFSFGFLMGPLVGGLFNPMQCGMFAVCGLALCMFWVIFALPETLKPTTQLEALQRLQCETQVKNLGGSNWHGLRILGRSSLFIKLTACTMLSGIVAEGFYELISQYLQLKLDFDVKDMSHLYTALGATGMCINMLVLRLLIFYMGETNMLRLGLFVSMVEMVLLAVVPDKLAAIGILCLGTLGNVVFPAIASIKSNNVAPSEQGTIQGALYGARALAQGVGPLIFAWLFALFSKGEHGLPVFPGAPFICGAVLMAVPVVIAFTINAKAADKGQFLQQLDDPVAEPLLGDGHTADEEAAAAMHGDEHKPASDIARQVACSPALGHAPLSDALLLDAPALCAHEAGSPYSRRKQAADEHGTPDHDVHKSLAGSSLDSSREGVGSWRLRAGQGPLNDQGSAAAGGLDAGVSSGSDSSHHATVASHAQADQAAASGSASTGSAS